MSEEVKSFIDDTERMHIQLQTTYARAMWDAATNGTPENNERQKQAQAALMRFWSDPGRFTMARNLHDSGAGESALEERLIKRLYLTAAKAQQDEATIERVTELQAEVRGQYYNFRPEVAGKRVSDNELDDILRNSRDSDEVRAAWLASKEVGAQVAEQVRELARLRNAAAQAQGFRDHFEKLLVLNEIEEDELMKTFGELEKATDAPFTHSKARIDKLRAERFGIDSGNLGPWHFGDRFFQSAPPLSDLDTQAIYKDQDPVALARATFEGMGMEVGDILERSDLYPREGKNQHAFCVDIDREGDIRTLNNLQPNERWTSTLLHELGHAVYDKYIDRELPWSLRRPSHSLTTEGMAMLLGALTRDLEWLKQILQLDDAAAQRYAEAGADRERADKLVFTRWSLVMTNFERGLYADPERPLDELWWDLVERYQKLPRPDRMAPDWAAKFHIALEPVYYQNYELGSLVAAQARAHMEREFGGIVGREDAGTWLRERFFWPGAREEWGAHIKSATGEALNLRYFVDSVS